MKSAILIAFSLALTGIMRDAPAATAPITYDTATGAVIPDPTWPFNFPLSTKTPALSVFNVKSAPYNAKGDGVTDDTTPIQNAITAAAAGGIVYLPGGTYRFSALSVSGNNCIIQGAGKDLAILKALSGDTLTLVTLGAPYSGIRDLTIDMSQSTAGNYALLLATSSFSEVSNTHILNPYNAGIGFSGTCQSVRIHDSVVEHQGAGYSAGQGIITNDNSDCSGTTISHCSIFNTGKDAIQLNGSAQTVDGCYISGTNPSGPSYFAGIFVKTGARRCTIANNIIQNCSSDGIDIAPGAAGGGGPDNSEGMIVIGNNCSNNGGGGISTGSNGTVIADNICRDNHTNANILNSSGIAVGDARNVIIKGNSTGNNAGSSSPQNYGILFNRINQYPNATVVDNDLTGNLTVPVSDLNSALSTTGYVFAHNRGLDDGNRNTPGSYTITPADTGATFTNKGAPGAITFTLPSPQEGLTFTFVVYNVQLITIAAPSAYIYVGNAHTANVGGSVSNGVGGSIITLRATSTNRWNAVAHEGTWTIN